MIIDKRKGIKKYLNDRGICNRVAHRDKLLGSYRLTIYDTSRERAKEVIVNLCSELKIEIERLHVRLEG